MLRERQSYGLNLVPPGHPAVIAGTPESACDKTVSTCKGKKIKRL